MPVEIFRLNILLEEAVFFLQESVDSEINKRKTKIFFIKKEFISFKIHIDDFKLQ